MHMFNRELQEKWYNEAMKIPITQSKAWQTLQNDLKETSFFEKTDDYQYLAILKRTPVGDYLYLPYGPVADDKQGIKQAFKSLNQLAIKHRCIFIRVEPQLEHPEQYLPKNAHKSTDLSPKETWLLDLAGNDDDLRAKLPSRLLRYYKNRAKQGITIETSHNPEDLKYLLSLQHALADKKGINTFSEHYLATELAQPFATLYLVRQNPSRDILAAGLVFDDDKTRYNLQGAQSEQGRKLHATGILTIQLILDAKAKNQQIFDFWGIAPEGAPADHPWAGFTNFKKTFAGYEKVYAGAYDLILHPFKYRLYQLFRQVNRKLRK